MSEFAANTFQSTKAWCREVDSTKRAASIDDLQEIAANILPKVVSRVTGRERMDRGKVMTVAWAAGMYLQAKGAETMQQINDNDWIADSYPDDVLRHYEENLHAVTEDTRGYMREDFEQEFADHPDFSEGDCFQATDLFFRVVAYYEAVESVHEEYLEALEAA